MTGIEPLTLDNAQEALNKLFKLGCNTVIITLGAEGAVFASRDEPEMTHVPVEKVKPVDTTVSFNFLFLFFKIFNTKNYIFNY